MQIQTWILKLPPSPPLPPKKEYHILKNKHFFKFCNLGNVVSDQKWYHGQYIQNGHSNLKPHPSSCHQGRINRCHWLQLQRLLKSVQTAWCDFLRSTSTLRHIPHFSIFIPLISYLFMFTFNLYTIFSFIRSRLAITLLGFVIIPNGLFAGPGKKTFFFELRNFGNAHLAEKNM